MSDQAFVILGWVVCVLALLLLAWALLLDWIRQRFRKRRRCPRCWYNMSRSPALTCSECGYVAKKEHKLFKARRRWRWAFVAVFLLVGSYALRVTPEVKERGWVAAVPTTVIIAALPWLDLKQSYGFGGGGGGGGFGGGFGGGGGGGFGGGLTYDLRLYNELYSRISEGRVWRWQQNLLAHRCLAGDSRRRPLDPGWHDSYGSILNQLGEQCRKDKRSPRWEDRAKELVEIYFWTRDVCPVGEPIYAISHLYRGYDWWDMHLMASPLTPGLEPIDVSSPWPGGRIWPSYDPCADSDQMTLGVIPEATDDLRYEITVEEVMKGDESREVRRRLIKRFEISLPTRVEGTLEEIVKPRPSAEIDKALREHARPTLLIDPDDQCFFLFGRPDYEVSDKLAALGRMTLALKVEILCSGEIVATGDIWYFLFDNGELRMMEPHCNLRRAFREGAREAVDLNAEWTITLRGDPAVALYDCMGEGCWEGEITLPLRIMNEDDFWQEVAPGERLFFDGDE